MPSRSQHRSQDMGRLLELGGGDARATWVRGVGQGGDDLFSGVDTSLASIAATVPDGALRARARRRPRPRRGGRDRRPRRLRPGRPRAGRPGARADLARPGRRGRGARRLRRPGLRRRGRAGGREAHGGRRGARRRAPTSSRRHGRSRDARPGGDGPADGLLLERRDPPRSSVVEAVRSPPTFGRRPAALRPAADGGRRASSPASSSTLAVPADAASDLSRLPGTAARRRPLRLDRSPAGRARRAVRPRRGAGPARASRPPAPRASSTATPSTAIGDPASGEIRRPLRVVPRLDVDVTPDLVARPARPRRDARDHGHAALQRGRDRSPVACAWSSPAQARRTISGAFSLAAAPATATLTQRPPKCERAGRDTAPRRRPARRRRGVRRRLSADRASAHPADAGAARRPRSRSSVPTWRCRSSAHRLRAGRRRPRPRLPRSARPAARGAGRQARSARPTSGASTSWSSAAAPTRPIRSLADVNSALLGLGPRRRHDDRPVPAVLRSSKGTSRRCRSTIARPHDRITDETAPVTILAPDDPVFTTPNRIGPDDWQGWVQERGLYMAAHLGPRATGRCSRCTTPTSRRSAGGLLVAHVGKGTYVYTGLAFFRQIPAGVPGAYRLFANLLALGRAAADEPGARRRRGRLEGAGRGAPRDRRARRLPRRRPDAPDVYSPHGSDLLDLYEQAFEKQPPDDRPALARHGLAGGLRPGPLGARQPAGRRLVRRVRRRSSRAPREDGLLAPYRPEWADAVPPASRAPEISTSAPSAPSRCWSGTPSGSWPPTRRRTGTTCWRRASRAGS